MSQKRSNRNHHKGHFLHAVLFQVLTLSYWCMLHESRKCCRRSRQKRKKFYQQRFHGNTTGDYFKTQPPMYVAQTYTKFPSPKHTTYRGSCQSLSFELSLKRTHARKQTKQVCYRWNQYLLPDVLVSKITSRERNID